MVCFASVNLSTKQNATKLFSMMGALWKQGEDSDLYIAVEPWREVLESCNVVSNRSTFGEAVRLNFSSQKDVKISSVYFKGKGHKLNAFKFVGCNCPKSADDLCAILQLNEGNTVVLKEQVNTFNFISILKTKHYFNILFECSVVPF